MDKKCLAGIGLAVALGLGASALVFGDAAKTWRMHDMNRPMAPVVTPGMPSTQSQVGTAPSDAVALFDGKDLSQWKNSKGTEPEWKVADGYLEVVKGKGEISTKEKFGDCQLHVEWMSPNPPKGSGQDRGNSGVFLMGRYELQVLDTYQNKTYADGQAGAIYGQYPPLVNPILPPGQSQTYDAISHRPHFDVEGKVIKPARVTLLFNGVLVQDNAELKGATANKSPGIYKKHGEKEPLGLQDHKSPVRYRNIWIRPLPEQ